jgi:hypothetical protein
MSNPIQRYANNNPDQVDVGEHYANTFGFTTNTDPQSTIMNVLQAVGYISAPELTFGVQFAQNIFSLGSQTRNPYGDYKPYTGPQIFTDEMNKKFTNWYSKAYGNPWDKWSKGTPVYQEMNWDDYSKDLTNRAIGTSLTEQGISAVQQAAALKNQTDSLKKQTQIIQGRTIDLNQASQAAKANANRTLSQLKGAVAQRSDLISQNQQAQQQAQQQTQQIQQNEVQQAQEALQQRAQAQIIQQQQKTNAMQQAQNLAQQRAAQNQPLTLKQILTAPPRTVPTKPQVTV